MSTNKKETLPVYIGVYKYSSVESAMERRGVQGISAEELEHILQTNGEAFVKSGDGKIHLWNVTGGYGHKMFLGKIKAVNE